MKKTYLAVSMLFVALNSYADIPKLTLTVPGSDAPVVQQSSAGQSLKPVSPSQVSTPSPAPISVSKPEAVSAPIAPAVPVKIVDPVLEKKAAISSPLSRQVATPSVVTNSQPVSTDLASDIATNPFTGKPKSAEQLQMELDTSKVRTQLLEEELKQTTLQQELKSVPAKKAVEQAQALSSFMKEQLVQKELGVTARPSPAVSSTNATPKKKVSKKQTAKKEAPVVVNEVKAPPAPMISASSILIVGNKKSAVLDIDGNILPVADGDQTPFGAVSILSPSAVKVGARTYNVSSSNIGRFTVSDNNRPEDKLKLQQGGMGVGVVPASATPASAQARSNTAVTLPPGVVLPPPISR